MSAQSLVAHPGLSHTDLQPNSVRETEGGRSQRFFQMLAARMGMKAARGALPQLRAATDPKAKGGQLYTPRFVNFGDPVRRPLFRRRQKAIDGLWSISENETGIQFKIDAA